MGRRVARIWKRGGAILKEWEVCKRPWLEFSLDLNEFHTVCPKIETKFLEKLGNSKVFSAQNQVISKKKRSSLKLRVIFRPKSEFQRFFRPKLGVLQRKKKKKGLLWNWELFFVRNPKFKGFFRPKSGVLQNKKKRFSPKLRQIFRPISQIQTFEGGCFRMGGGYFQFFTTNRPQNHKKHAILHTSQVNGGARAPPPPLATLLYVGQSTL